MNEPSCRTVVDLAYSAGEIVGLIKARNIVMEHMKNAPLEIHVVLKQIRDEIIEKMRSVKQDG